jgi:predicted metal-dependent peptidase
VTAGLDTDRLSAARFRAAHEYPYLASAIFALAPVCCTELPYRTMAVDRSWRLYIDPHFLAETPIGELAGVFVHETLHCVFDHAGRSEAEHPLVHEIWNLAADAVINGIITTHSGTSGCPLPLPNPVLPEHLGGTCDTDVVLEGLYRNLLSQSGSPIDGWACGSAAHGRPASWELDAEPDGARLDASAHEVIRQRVMADVRRTTSSVPAALGAWAGIQGRTPVDWRTELAQLVATAAGRGGDRQPTYRRPNRRQRHDGLLLPGTRSAESTVAVVVDTSGSMHRHYLGAAVDEVLELLRHRRPGGRRQAVWACDTDATFVPITDTNTITFSTRQGGTDMRVGIQAAIAGQPRPQAVVVLTDGHTPWPSESCIPIIAGIVHDQHHPPPKTPPWIHRILIPDDTLGVR